MTSRGHARLRVIPGALGARQANERETPDPAAVRGGSSPDLTAVRPDLTPVGAGLAQPTHAVAPPSSVTAALSHLDDAQLVTLGARGERRALEALYRRHVAFAIHLATRIEGSARDVEDIAHDAFLKAFQHLGELTDPRSFRSWLGSIVVHAVRSRMRRTRLMNALGLSNLFGRAAEPIDLDTIASSDASPLVRAQLAQIYALLRTLPTDDRIAWTLRSLDGHDLETVAKMCGCSLATVKRRISRAQKYLDEAFVQQRSEGPAAPASSAQPPVDESSS